MSWIQNDSLNLANVLNTMRSYQWFNGLGYVCAGNEIFSILFDNRKTQPAARAIDHDLAAATDKFQRILHRLEFHFLAGSGDACRQSVKLRDVVDAQIIAATYFDNLPSIRGRCCFLRHRDGTGQERDREPTFHWEDHACAIVSETCPISRSDAFPAPKAFGAARVRHGGSVLGRTVVPCSF